MTDVVSGNGQCHRLKSVSIIGGFLDGQTFNLADGLNCVIGARGTGKTTVLELVRYAMDAMPADPAAQKRIESLVETNLAGGRVQVGVRTKDGLSYVVSRSVGEEPVVLADDGTPTEISLRAGGLFKIDIFSQNEVEAIADQASSQLDLIDNFETEELSAIEHRARALRADGTGDAIFAVLAGNALRALGSLWPLRPRRTGRPLCALRPLWTCPPLPTLLFFAGCERQAPCTCK